MSIEQFIDNEVKSNDVVLFMKGTPQFPQCGFSGQVVQILDHVGVGYKGLNVLESAELRNGIKDLFELADHSAALRQGRVRRRLRHHPRDVPGRRIAAAVCRQGRRGQRGGLGLSLAARQIGKARLEVIVADITTLSVDAIVNAANYVAARRRRRRWRDPSRRRARTARRMPHARMAARPATPRSPKGIGCRRGM